MAVIAGAKMGKIVQKVMGKGKNFGF